MSLLALLLLLGWPGSAVADTALWSMVPLPGGRAALLPRLGLRADVPRAIAIAEIIRVVHQARDPRGPAYTALETYLASPPPSGDELVPFPLPPAVWRDHVLGRAVDDQHLLGAILLDHRAALICYGLYGLDEQTLAFLAEQPSVLRRLYQQDATAFASFAHLLHVRGTALELPGGHEAAAIWEQLLGAPLSDPAAAITALLTHDNGRLAYFAEACSTLDSVRVRHLFPGGKTFKASVAATRAIARAFIDVDAARNLTDLPFQRVAYDPLARSYPQFAVARQPHGQGEPVMTSSAQLQREANAARVGLADTLGQLRDGVAPAALSAEAIALVKDSGLSILKALSDSARANPVPALLIGAGLTMLLTRTTGSDVMGVATSTLKSAAATGVDAARSAASGAASSVAGAAREAAGSVAGAASDVAGAAKDAVKGAADRTARRRHGYLRRRKRSRRRNGGVGASDRG